MGLFTVSKRQKYKKFDYQPRYFNPEKDQKIRERIRIKTRARRRRSPAGLIYFLILLMLAIFIYRGLM